MIKSVILALMLICMVTAFHDHADQSSTTTKKTTTTTSSGDSELVKALLNSPTGTQTTTQTIPLPGGGYKTIITKTTLTKVPGSGTGATTTTTTTTETATTGSSSLTTIATGSLQPVFRWWSAGAGDHFYCLDPKGEIAPQVGYVYEGIEFCTLKTQVQGSTPLYRLWGGNSDHFYTTDDGEAARSGYSREGNIGFIFPASRTVNVNDASGKFVKQLTTVPLYRWYQPGSGDHFYFVNPSKELHVQSGYKDEGIAGYVFKGPCEDVAAPESNLLRVKQTDFQPVFRWWSAGAGDHFYCLDPKGEIAPQVGYVSEGIEFCTFKTQVQGSTPLYRLWGGNSDHFYTTDDAEAARSGYSREGNVGFIFPKSTTVRVDDANGNQVRQETSVPLYRWYQPGSGDHFYFVNPSKELHVQSGYRDEGIAGYVFLGCK